MNRYKKDSILFKQQTDQTIKCKCGHSCLLGFQDKIICSWCGNWVYKDKQTEFKYKLMKEMK